MSYFLDPSTGTKSAELFLLLVNNAAMNMSPQISVQVSAFSLLGYTSRRGIAGSNCNSISFFRNYHIVFYNSNKISHFHLSAQGFKFLHIFTNLFFFPSFSFCFRIMGVKWYLIVILICISLIISYVEDTYSLNIIALFKF